MVTVTLKCITCGKVHEVDAEIFFDMRKSGEILNPSHRGRVKSINCCSGKASSRGKPKPEPKPKTPTESKPKPKPTEKPKKESKASLQI